MIPSRFVLTTAAALLVGQSASAASIAPREIQIKSVDFTTGVIELHNLGDSTVALDGWRFCTHDEDQDRRYSGSTGLNGVSIAAGNSLFVHYNNDASAGNEINISTIGGSFATTLDSGSYAIGLYWQTPFGTGSNIADHIQWSIGGVDNTSADERSDEAVAGGVWTSETDWIATTASTTRIELADLSGSDLQDSSDYNVIPEPSSLALLVLGGWMLARRRRD